MRNMIRGSRQLLAALLICVAPRAAQQVQTPALQPARMAGELGSVGFALGSHAGLVAGATRERRNPTRATVMPY